MSIAILPQESSPNGNFAQMLSNLIHWSTSCENDFAFETISKRDCMDLMCLLRRSSFLYVLLSSQTWLSCLCRIFLVLDVLAGVPNVAKRSASADFTYVYNSSVTFRSVVGVRIGDKTQTWRASNSTSSFFSCCAFFLSLALPPLVGHLHMANSFSPRTWSASTSFGPNPGGSWQRNAISSSS